VVAVLAPTQEYRDETHAVGQARRQAASARKDDRMKHFRAIAMLAGGSQNINSGNRPMFSQLAMLPEDQQQNAIRYMLPGGDRSAAVDARNAETSGKMAQQAMTAFLANNPGATPQARAAAEMQLENAGTQQSAAIQADAERLVNERADDQGWFNLPTRLIGGGAEGWDNTLLTVEEEEAAIRKLMAKYPHLSYDEARQQVEAAADGKTRQPRETP
jgi:hypothetical protein